MDPLTDSDEAAARIGRVVDERYRILEAMASGSMGAVYKAERVPVGKLVAIKFLHASFANDGEFQLRFERETQVMSKLAHPNCVSVVDFGVWEGAPYLVMEYVAGTTLRALIDQAPLEPQRALALTRQIAAGLAHAHAQGIVHRDVKPANIMISEEIGTGDHVRILDFGLARLRGNVGRDATQHNVVVGTPNYMAPEQTIGGGTIDARTDVYAVGVVLFEMISGQRPFSSEDTLQLLGMHRAAPIPRLADRIDRSVILPDGLQALIERAMAKSPDDRFQSAIELAQAIDELSGPRPGPEYNVAATRSDRALADTDAIAPTIVDVGHGRSAEVEALRRAPAPRASALGGLLMLLVFLGGVGAAVWYLRIRPAAKAIATDRSSRAADASGYARSDPSASGSGAAAVGADASAGSAVAVAVEAGRVAAIDDAGPALGVGAGSALGDSVGSGAALAAAPDAGLTLGADARAPGEGSAIATAAPADAAVPTEDGAVDDEIEMDPMAATNPDPEAEVHTGEDEAPDAPATPEDVEKRVPAAPVLASSVREAVRMIQAGKRDVALGSLRALWKKNPRSAYIPFLLGNLYNDRLWWSVAMDHYKLAIKKNGAYKGNAVLNKNVIRMLASPRTQRRATTFLRWTVGRSARPYLRWAAKHEKNANVRRRAAALAKVIR